VEILERVIVYLPVLMLALSAHEAAHAWAASVRGDRTALDQGRLSLLPWVHVDLVGSLLIPGMLFALNAPYMVGYAKPTPVNPGLLKSPKRDFSLVALAGPGGNLALALAFAGLGALAFRGLGVESQEARVLVAAGIVTNALLCWINLLPLPGFDGLKALYVFMPDEWCWRLQRVDRLFFPFLIVAAAVGVLDKALIPAFELGRDLCTAAGTGPPFL
jgi:Zn-dependent protease